MYKLYLTHINYLILFITHELKNLKLIALLFSTETTTFEAIEDLPDTSLNAEIEEQTDRLIKKAQKILQKSRRPNPRRPAFDGESAIPDNDGQYKNSVYLSNQKNKSIEDVISTRISNSFENNFPNSIKIFNELVLPTKETALKELRTAAETAPTGQ